MGFGGGGGIYLDVWQPIYQTNRIMLGFLHGTTTTFFFLKNLYFGNARFQVGFALTCNSMGLVVSINEFGTQAISNLGGNFVRIFFEWASITRCHVTLYCRSNCVFELNQFWVGLISS